MKPTVAEVLGKMKECPKCLNTGLANWIPLFGSEDHLPAHVVIERGIPCTCPRGEDFIRHSGAYHAQGPVTQGSETAATYMRRLPTREHRTHSEEQPHKRTKGAGGAQ